MSNPYKKIVEKLMCKFPYLMDEKCQWYCRFCKVNPDEDHLQNCLYLQAKTLIDQDPDREEDNPWILCSERLPEEDGEYEITLKTLADFSRGEFDWSEYNSCGNSDVVNWRRKLKPYQPPPQKPETPVAEPEKTPEPTPDPLMGWKPIWRDGLPDTSREVRVLLQDGGSRNLRESVGYCDKNEEWFIHWRKGRIIVAWKELDIYPDPKLFEKPTPPAPKHLPPDFTWKRLCEELPAKPGRYYFFDEDRNVIIEQIITKDRFPFKDAQEIQRLIGFGTHWVLLSVFV